MSALVLTSDEGVYGIEQTICSLQAHESGLDALEKGVRQVERDPRACTVALGGAPNLLGYMECDASVMNGQSLQVGSVGAIRGCAHPITAARRVMEVLPHVMLVGDGASRFATEMGVEAVDLLSNEANEAYEKWLSEHVGPVNRDSLSKAALAPYVSFKTRRNLSKGTVTFLVRDSEGMLFGGVSTSGWAYKYPGRLGDSPVIGAGLYVDNRYGAAACTHTGEMTIRAGTARSVVLYMKRGARVDEACHEAVQDLRDLKGGYLGPVIIHALDRHGEPYVATTGGDDGDMYYFWREGMTQVVESSPIVVP